MPPKIRLCLILLASLAACRQEPPPPAPAPTPQEKERAELTLQSRRGWKPEGAPRKLTIQLISEKTKVRKGEGFRYRLELQNVGREPLAFKESPPSFIKGGSLCGDHGYRFYATSPDGTQWHLPCEPEAVPAAVSTAAPASAMPPDTGLDQTLRPGDYLLTRPDGLTTRFRTLRTKFRFDALGTYRLRVVYAAPKLRAESNSVALTVVR